MRADRWTTRLPSPHGTESAVVEAIQKRMREIIIPNLTLEIATIPEAIAALKVVMAKTEPVGHGIGLLVILDSPGDSDAIQPEPGTDRRVTIRLRNATMEETVDRFCLATGLNWMLAPRLTIGPEEALRKRQE